MKRRLRSTREVWVRTTKPGVVLKAQAGCINREPSTSTRQMRQAPAGSSRSSWHSTGMSTSARRAAWRMVSPSR